MNLMKYNIFYLDSFTVFRKMLYGTTTNEAWIWKTETAVDDQYALLKGYANLPFLFCEQ